MKTIYKSKKHRTICGVYLQRAFLSAWIVISYMLLCVYIVYVLSLIFKNEESQSFYLIDGILYIFAQAPFYYLCIVPVILLAMNYMVSVDSLNEYILTRTVRRKYAVGQMLAAVIYCAAAALVILITAGIIYMAFASKSVYRQGADLLNLNVGSLIVRGELLDVPGVLLIGEQLFITVLSLAAMGLLFLYLRNILRQQSAAIVICLVVNFVVYLLTKIDLPKVIRYLYPYEYTFLSYNGMKKTLITDSKMFWAPIAYWGIIIVFLSYGLLNLIKRKDFVGETEKKNI